MTLKNALKLHNGDEVTLKESGRVLTVVETEYVPKEQTSNGIAGLSFRLSDGNWYGHKEIK